jgi:hypothetical protein
MKHIVTDGECIESVAVCYGFEDSSTILDHPENAALKKKRPDGTLLHPGDAIFIPPVEPKVHVLATGRAPRPPKHGRSSDGRR